MSGGTTCDARSAVYLCDCSSLQRLPDLAWRDAEHSGRSNRKRQPNRAAGLAELAQPLAGPKQRRLRITACVRLDEGTQIVRRVGSVSTSGLRPPPGRRTRDASHGSPARSSLTPIVLRAIPVIRDTAAIPPRPAACASKRERMADSSISQKAIRSRFALESPDRIQKRPRFNCSRTSPKVN